MPQITVSRFGSTVGVSEPEPVPDALRAFTYPAEIVKLLDASDAEWVKVQNASADWQQAHDYLENAAAEADKQTLLKALRAGKGDPGTPAQDKARRDEEVAWTRYQIAREDADAPSRKAQEAVRKFIETHPDKLAAHELEVLDVAVKAKADADAAMEKAQQAARIVGLHYISAHSFTEQSVMPDSWMMPGEFAYTRQGNWDALRQRYETLRDGKPAAGVDVTTFAN